MASFVFYVFQNLVQEKNGKEIAKSFETYLDFLTFSLCMPLPPLHYSGYPGIILLLKQ